MNQLLKCDVFYYGYFLLSDSGLLISVSRKTSIPFIPYFLDSSLMFSFAHFPFHKLSLL